MNKALSHREVQDFIAENYNADLSRIIFQGSPFPEIPVQELAVQLSGKKKAEKKLPTWFRTPGIIYPPTVNLEQTSSEKTAAYKASLISGQSMIDLSGGFGVDAYYFSRKFERVVHCELNASLSEVVSHNMGLLKVPNIETYSGDGLEYLKSHSSESFSWIYVDPSRRSQDGGRVFHLSECLPNVPENLELFFSKSPRVLMKTSPFLDLQAGISALNGIREIHVVAVENDVKELLWFLEKDFSGPLQIKTVNLKKKGNQFFESQMGPRPEPRYTPPLSYLYEPNAAIMKSGLFEALAQELNLEKLHPNSHLFTSEELKKFPGRRFRILETLPYNRKKIKAALKVSKANIAIRNFPESVAALKKIFKITDGGNTYLFFTTSKEEKRILLVCQKINEETEIQAK